MRFLYRILLVLILIGGSAAAWVLPGAGAAPDSAPPPGVARREAIAFHERRLIEDPAGALDMARLASLMMEEGRMTLDEGLYVKAESLARRSLKELTRRNGRSTALLVNSLLAQHRFAEAVPEARALVEAEPEMPAYRALLAEALMEVGEYADAARMLGSVRAQRESLGIAPRFARWAELTGQPGEARRILRAACVEAARRRDLSPEQQAWFFVRLADLEIRHGYLRSARSTIRDGLARSAGDWRLIMLRARLDLLRSRPRAAARAAEEVTSLVPEPAAFAVLAGAHRELGDSPAAESWASALEGVAFGSRTVHRGWALALLDVGGDSVVDRIVALAEADTLVRRDIHGLDLLAWALHRAGRSGDAQPLARRSLATGSVEPSLRFHSGMIELAAGDTAAAVVQLEIALDRRGALTRSEARAARGALEHARRTIRRGD